MGFAVRFRCEIAEKSLHITCVSLNIVLSLVSISLHLSYLSYEKNSQDRYNFKPGFHIVLTVVPVVSVVQKKFIGQIEFILSRTTRCICHFYCIAWFPYRCICRICRVCRMKKIHGTDITLWKPPVQILNTKETTDTTC